MHTQYTLRREFFSVAWKSYCLYLLIYLVHFPFAPHFIGLFFLHPDQNIKLPASWKPNTKNLPMVWKSFCRMNSNVIWPLCVGIFWYGLIPILMHFKTMATTTAIKAPKTIFCPLQLPTDKTARFSNQHYYFYMNVFKPVSRLKKDIARKSNSHCVCTPRHRHRSQVTSISYKEKPFSVCPAYCKIQTLNRFITE